MKPLAWTTTCTILVAASAVWASPASDIKVRVAGYRALGAAFKQANESIRPGEGNVKSMRSASQSILRASKAQYSWYPAGSGPSSGAKTAALPRIWKNAAEFRVAQDAFGREALNFDRAVASGDEAVMRAQARKLGAKCKACHDSFRQSDD